MSRYSAKQRRMRGLGKRSGGPPFIQLFHYIKRSTAYHGLSPYARALLLELIDRYNGCNNGMIVLGIREAAYELGCGQATVGRAMREIDDAGLARPTTIGAWRGKRASEWRLMWRRCDKTGDLPKTQWPPRQPHSEFRSRSAKVPLQKHRENLSSAPEAEKRKNPINGSEPSSAPEAHVHIYQGHGGEAWDDPADSDDAEARHG